ncbi:hypothetical protein ABPG77_001606 [Micractinium sp. CCAP 211/92]
MADDAGVERGQLVVAGLRNCGNTCFLNAVLQALASCEALLKHLNFALELLNASALPAATAATAPLPPPRHLALAAALLDVLDRLQPTDSRGSFAPRLLLALLRSRLPPGLLEPGEEHDAAEAAGSLLDLVSAELQAAFASTGTQRSLLGRASLTAVLNDSPCLSSAKGSGSGRWSSAGPGDSAPISAESSGQHGGCNGAAVCEPGIPADASSVLSHPMSSGCSDGEGGRCFDEAAQAAEPGHEASKHTEAKPCPACPLHEARAPAAAAVPPAAGPPVAPATSAPAAGQGAAPAALPAAAAAAAVSVPPPDPVLHAWRRGVALPLQGSTAGELQCMRCGHRSCLQLAPFRVLPLGIPAAAGRTLLGNVPAAPGAALEGCLAAFCGYEALQGVHCTRCSLRASLEAAGSTAAPAGGSNSSGNDSSGGDNCSSGHSCDGNHNCGMCSASQVRQLQQLQRVLADSSALLLESEAYRGMLERAGLAWVPRPSPAVRRTVAAVLPRVLCLQLRRGFWSQHGHVKITGHVSFPLELALPLELLPRLGHEPGRQPGSGAAAVPAAVRGGQGAACTGSGSTVPRYLLRAVVVHHGGLARAGHYTVFRCLDSLAQQAQRAAAAQRWLGASDEEVRPAAVADVLAAEASMLIYERPD